MEEHWKGRRFCCTEWKNIGEAVAKRVRLGLRTPVLFTMKMLFCIMFVSKKYLVITIIVLDDAVKLRTELIKEQNHNTIEKIHGLWTFSKNDIFGGLFF